MTGAVVESTGTASARRDVVTAVLGAWLIVGLFLDGYMHNTRGDQLESFFTPWHGVLYAGFAASALWIAAPMRHTRGTVRERLAALPTGYAAGAVGVLVFAIGGIADSVWHSVLGVEVDLEALLSPPHLVLFAGAMLILTTPVRAAWTSLEDAPSLRRFAPALASVTLATLLVGFFFMYASGLFDFHGTAAFARIFEPGGRLVEHAFLEEILNGFGAVARVVTTVILIIPTLLLVRRWTPPAGTFTVLFAAYAVFMFVLQDFRQPGVLAAAPLAGVVADVLVARLRPTVDRPHATRVFAATVPAVMWLAHFALLAVTGDLGWPFTLWGGVVLFCSATGYALSLLVVPPAPPDRPTATSVTR